MVHADVPLINPNPVPIKILPMTPLGIAPQNANGSANPLTGSNPPIGTTPTNTSGIVVNDVYKYVQPILNGSSVTAYNTISSNGNIYITASTYFTVTLNSNEDLSIKPFPVIDANGNTYNQILNQWVTMYQPAFKNFNGVINNNPDPHFYNELAGSYSLKSGNITAGGVSSVVKETTNSFALNPSRQWAWLPDKPIYIGNSIQISSSMVGGQVQIATLEGQLDATFYQQPQQLTPKVTSSNANTVSGTGTKGNDIITLYQSSNGSIPAQGATSIPSGDKQIGQTTVSSDGTWSLSGPKLTSGTTYYVQETNPKAPGAPAGLQYDFPGYAAVQNLDPTPDPTPDPTLTLTNVTKNIQWSVNYSDSKINVGGLLATATPFSVTLGNYYDSTKSAFSIAAQSTGIALEDGSNLPILYSADGKTTTDLSNVTTIMSANNSETTNLDAGANNTATASFKNLANFYIQIPSANKVTSGKSYSGNIDITLNNTPQ